MGTALLALFSRIYSFFAGGYSATWSGIVKELEKEVNNSSEFVDTSVIFGLLNGGRGVGYIVGDLARVELMKLRPVVQRGSWPYASKFGSLILLTAFGATSGGLNILWKAGKALLRLWGLWISTRMTFLVQINVLVVYVPQLISNIIFTAKC